MIITLKGATFTKYLDLNSWMIISDLVGVTSSNTATKIDKNSKYETTFTIEEGYTLSEATVTCNGTTYPLTWTDGSATLTIDSVTAAVNIRIKATRNQVEEPDVPETPVTPTTYTITYKYMCGGTSVKAQETETVDAGTVMNFATTDSRAAVNGYTCTAVSQTSATINSNITVTYTYASSAAVVNLWTITDTDALFENGIYRNTSGVDAGASNFNNTYPSSDKIYINGNTGTFSLNLEGGKTYRWQMVPYYEYGSVKLASPWSNSDGTSPGNFHGKRFWFYDAEDNMIANDKTTSPDGVYLMTVPSDAVYMRFMGWGYFSTNGNVPKKYPTNLMVTEGETEHTEYIAPNV